MNINENIKALLKSKNKQQKQLSESIGVSTSTLNNWLKLNRSIPAEYLIPICEFLDVSPYSLIGDIERDNIVLSDDHKSLIKLYDKLDERGKGKVIGVAETLAELAAERAAQEAEKEKPAATIQIAPAADETPEQDEEYKLIEIRHGVYKVSAGLGFDLDEGDSWETIDIPATPEARRADYALTIIGDSMEPVYYDGDIVLVREQPAVDIGQIGIFILDGSGYIKKFCGDHLVSMNEDYDDIPLSDYEDVRCSGRVIVRV